MTPLNSDQQNIRVYRPATESVRLCATQLLGSRLDIQPGASSTSESREPISGQQNIDWFLFIGSMAIILGICVPLALYPELGKSVLSEGYEYITESIGVVYVLFSFATLVFLLYLAFSRFGSVRLGEPNEQPQFSSISWSAMLFCGGIGASVMYWGTIEWAHYLQSPPFGLASGSAEAVPWARSYPVFHWGFTGWALYCLPAVAIAHAYHVRKIPTLHLSAVCEPILGKYSHGLWGRFIDLTFVVGLLGAASTGIGLVVPLIGECVRRYVDLPVSFGSDVLVIAIITAIFACSVWLGLEKGIKRLSNLNVFLALGFIAFVFVAGPTRFIAESSTATIGHLLQNFLVMSTWTDPAGQSRFVEDWTIFYWAWWLALGPYMGMFISKISRGRTIKELILASLGYGTAGCALFFMVLGNYALFAEQSGLVNVLQVLQEQNATVAIVDIMMSLPGAYWVLPVFMLVCLIFAATSYDSTSYVLASATTRALPQDAHPARWNRMFWAFSLGLLPITLLYIGGLRALQSAVVAASLPLLIVTIIMTAALLRTLRVDSGQRANAPVALTR